MHSAAPTPEYVPVGQAVQETPLSLLVPDGHGAQKGLFTEPPDCVIR